MGRMIRIREMRAPAGCFLVPGAPQEAIAWEAPVVTPSLFQRTASRSKYRTSAHGCPRARGFC